MRKATEIIMYSTSWCSDCFRAKAFFNEYEIPYSEIDIEKTADATEIVKKINNGNASVPTIIITWEDGRKTVTVEPSRLKLAEIFATS